MDHVLDIENISTSIEKELEILSPLSEECCIYRVPKALRNLNETAYTPQLVSIGPIHHGKPELKQMEEHKKRSLQEFLHLTNVSIASFVDRIKAKETKFRNCYAETLEFSSEDLVKMILVDVAFVIMVLLKFSCQNLRSSNDRIYSRPWMENEVRYDLLLLENQLPFFILKDLYEYSDVSNRIQEEGLSMIKLTREFFKGKWGLWVTRDVLENQNLSNEVVHFVDFLRISQKPSKSGVEDQEKPKEAISLYAPTATELQQAGVKFELSSSRKKLDIQFNNGVLKIPLLRITRKTEFFLRNLQAFEQCHCKDKYINDYIAFITMLVKNPKDLEILVKSGILVHGRWNNDSLSAVFLNLALGNFVSHKSFYLSGLVEDLNLYCGKSWHKWKATLKEQYFNSPWAVISVIAASILLILTIIQTVCTVMQI
ncbi:UPF0481 protein At3g47200-like [Mercurialis annua]|uniref:UPF0481 protein At3g47200-like n=1 Tax=Mercurialis annua TaxID=3986 RepID=UPI00215F72B6|nr:UPF0481 protein At3g47200-like [Mercurialis annua]